MAIILCYKCDFLKCLAIEVLLEAWFTHWLLQEITFLLIRQNINNAAGNTDSDTEQPEETKHDLKTKNKFKQWLV